MGVPDSILVELTNHCNLKCPVCPTTHGMTRPRGFMTRRTFDMMVTSLQKHGLRPQLRFMFAGEPMVHEDIPWFMERAHRAQMRTFVCTNGTRYREFNNVGPSAMTVCVDGIGEAHEKYRVGSDFVRTLGVIKGLIDANPSTMFTMQSLVTKWSEGQENDLIELAKEIGIHRVRFKNLHLGHGFVKGAEDVGPKDRSKDRKFRWTPICLAGCSHVVVYWDGSLGVCCIDYDNVGDNRPVDMGRFVEEVEKFKWRRWRGVLKGYSICKACQMTGAKGMSREVWL